ncbi:MFS transporter [Brevibacterium sp. 50QC2O2]|uniref:MFS transporter n=1 Tax=Brevibacterium TaxID=1696 RepID=UPI00211D0B0B|nr:MULTISPECIES: MFS transporter [unclassified Brevibacterium]MCQ9369373.1 MFS transporter [Brevibacterium sp. 91QC2O2]MCQ9386726.1 MFS transporter [Brevibacterium sp. 68QC2CO]MCQ9389692.1 MFS transporter [Brevibacterium sp. 50QC2O2]
MHSRTGKSPKPHPERLKVEHVNVVPPTKLKPAIGGTLVGNFMEWYDFGIYGYLAVVMTGVFASGLPTQWQLLATLLGFAVSFLVRPLGGLVLGPLGDKFGRRKILFFTMSVMAGATALIGLLPTANTLGVWALVLLYLLKMLQGFSTGGEYAGAATYVAEFAPDRKRGFFSSMLDTGSYMGFAAGATVVGLTTWISTSVSGPDAMAEYGWRIPFLTAIPLGIIAVWLRSRLPETPAFEVAEASADLTDVDHDDPYARHGFIGLIRHHWRPLLVAMAIVAATNSAGYALTSYMPVYLEEEVGYSSITSALATVPVLVVMSICIPIVGFISDRVGRRPVYAAAAIATVVLTVPAFKLMHLGTLAWVMVALSLIAIPVALWVGPSAAALPALFPTATRYTGMGLSYNLAVSAFGGTTPLFTQALMQWTGNNLMPAFYIMFFSIIAGVAILAIGESARKPLTGSLPIVATHTEARALVAFQDRNPDLDLETIRVPVNA